MRKTGLLLLLCLGFVWGNAQDENYYYEDAVYKESIKTVLLYRTGLQLSNPLLGLNEDQTLTLSFDDLTSDVKDYYYTIIHCDAEWNESFMSQSMYIDGFFENPITDYDFSFNTSFRYVNYQVELPNEQMRFKLSGNYVLVVFEDNDPEKVVLSRRFRVFENQVTIQGTVHRSTFDAFKGTSQEIDFSVYHPTFTISNPLQDVKVVLQQNNRWDNAITNLKPRFIRKGELDYEYDQGNVFEGGNEFRYFDIRTNSLNGENVESTEYFRPYYHKTLMVDQIRSNKKYSSYEEMNGKYSVESQDREINDPNTECDYAFVHFTLPMETPLVGGSVNVFGALTQWNINKGNEMTYNFDTGKYELTLLLKQGYYNYIYAYVSKGGTKVDYTNIEGSFWETENDYQIFVYYRDTAARYDRLIGYRGLNSIDNRN